MKKIKQVVLIIILLFAALMMFSCNKYISNGTKIGILELKNNSVSTVQEVWVNGVTYGNLRPSHSIKIKLQPGVYTWELRGLNGEGCKPVTTTIPAGYTQTFQCSVK